jgi:hypothetical protein
MLRGIVLENFEPFSGRRSLRVAPLTLLLGENSAGKRSILQSLLLLQQMLLTGDEDTLLLFNGPLVFLGRLGSLIHGHDLGRELVIAPIFDVSSVPLLAFRKIESIELPY